jgi:hypothetical protein
MTRVDSKTPNHRREGYMTHEIKTRPTSGFPVPRKEEDIIFMYRVCHSINLETHSGVKITFCEGVHGLHCKGSPGDNSDSLADTYPGHTNNIHRHTLDWKQINIRFLVGNKSQRNKL